MNNYNNTLGYNMLLILQTIFTNRERRLALRADNIHHYGIVQTVAILRSGINAFYLSKCIHKQETGVRCAFVQNKTGREERSLKLHFFTASFYGFKSNSIFSWQPNLYKMS